MSNKRKGNREAKKPKQQKPTAQTASSIAELSKQPLPVKKLGR